jgi:hypothetical protein
MNDPVQGMQALGKFVPGFDFLQGLVKNAGSTLPFSQWVAPTLDPKELDKRIDELRTVQFWLEQNARLLATTIQALEVQRMTLSTLQSMNVSADALRDSLMVRMPEPRAAEARHQAKVEPETKAAPEAEKKTEARKPATKPGKDESGDGAVDPMQWWGALTRQFATLASTTMAEALKESAATAKPSSDAAPEQRKDAAPSRKPATKSTRAGAGAAGKSAHAAKASARRPSRTSPKA